MHEMMLVCVEESSNYSTEGGAYTPYLKQKKMYLLPVKQGRAVFV